MHKLKTKVKDQEETLKEYDAEIDSLHNKLIMLETRVENQEQYSRRTSLRLHNVPVPTDERGKIQHPLDTEKLALDIFNNKLGLQITPQDIGRSHLIGKTSNGKSQIIVRFILLLDSSHIKPASWFFLIKRP